MKAVDTTGNQSWSAQTIHGALHDGSVCDRIFALGSSRNTFHTTILARALNCVASAETRQRFLARACHVPLLPGSPDTRHMAKGTNALVFRDNLRTVNEAEATISRYAGSLWFHLN